jgi:CRP-like cAMP-binding protein/AmiR/NasT family two-component response regulator
MGKKKIIVIEDNKQLRESIVEALTIADYEVFDAPNGRIGVSLIREVEPDLILCDIIMPELDGFGVLYALSRDLHTANIPFVFLSSRNKVADIRKALMMGADDYLIKPFDNAELFKTIELRLKKSEQIKKEFSKIGTEIKINPGKQQDDIRALCVQGQVRSFKKKEIVFREGQYPHNLYLVESGKIKVYKTNAEGKEYISRIFSKGDYFGYLNLFEDTMYNVNAEVMEDASLYLIPRHEFLQLVTGNSGIALRFMKMLADNLIEHEQHLIDMAYNSVRKRIAQALVYLKSKLSGTEATDKPSFNIVREDLAHIAGTSTESAVRTLSEFKAEKIIEIHGGSITLLNIDKLERMRN